LRFFCKNNRLNQKQTFANACWHSIQMSANGHLGGRRGGVKGRGAFGRRRIRAGVPSARAGAADRTAVTVYLKVGGLVLLFRIA